MTREAPGDDPFLPLRERGADVRSLPLSNTCYHADSDELRRALDQPERYAWIAVTSVRGVAVLDSLPAERVQRLYRECRWACVGPATARAVSERRGVDPELVSTELNAADLARRLLERVRDEDTASKPVLFLRAANARRDLPDTLAAGGVPVDEVVAYTVSPAHPDPADLQPPDGRDHWDAIVATSSLSIEVIWSTLEGAGWSQESIRSFLQRGRVAVLGESSERALRDRGVAPWIRPARPLLTELVQVLQEKLWDQR